MGKDYNRSGEIINRPEWPSRVPSDTRTPTQTPPPRENGRGTFLATTLIGSPIIYGGVGALANQLLEIGLSTEEAVLIGSLLGLVTTAVYNFFFAKDCTGQDYAKSLGLPALVILIIAVGYIIIMIAIVLLVLAALLGGG